MRFLVDQNLPDVLADWLNANRHVAEHVKTLGLAEAADPVILAHAKLSAAIVISKDADFAASGGMLQVVWVRIGNTTNERLLSVWTAAWPQICAALESGDRIVEVRAF